MEYVIYKLDFITPVHFGKNDLAKSENTFMADTLFSALCNEAVKYEDDTLDRLYQAFINRRLLISDAFPYIGDTYYLPKPILRVENKESQGDSKIKKAYKKLNYIPADKIDIYMEGKLNPQDEEKRINTLGAFDMKISAVIEDGMATPYYIRQYSFNKGNGLYIIVGYEDEDDVYMIEELLEGLSYVGIGGRRSSGMGRFELKRGKTKNSKVIFDRLAGSGERKMTLSISLPREDEIHNALDGARYVLLKRSGFAETYGGNAKPSRKKDIYMLKSGSCFQNKYDGDIYNVATNQSHEVYKYGIPMWMEV